MSAGTTRYPAPPVTFPVRRSGRMAGALLALHAASLVVLSAWLFLGAGAARAPAGPALLAWAAAAVLTVRFWRRQPVGELVWDGACWQLQRSVGPPAEQALGPDVAVQLDLQRQMVLALAGARPAVWLYVECRHGPERWPDVRRAVYSRPSAAGPVPADRRQAERTP